MAVIYLKHPLHGEMPYSSDLEANVARSNGWVDFDPTLAVPEVVIEPKLPSFLTPVVSNIPESFPARQFLIEGGVTKWDDLLTKTEPDLVAINGIGPATAREILDKLNS